MAFTYRELFEIDWYNGGMLRITKRQISGGGGGGSTGPWLSLGFTNI